MDIYFSLTFNFNVCDGSSDYCSQVNKAKDLVIIHGSNQNHDLLPFKSFKQSSDGSLAEIKSDDEMPWSWPRMGNNMNKSGIMPQLPNEDITFEYSAAAFVRLWWAMIVAVEEIIDYYWSIYYREIDKTGNWGEWTVKTDKFGLNGLFVFNDNLYGLDNTEPFGFEFNKDFQLVSNVCIILFCVKKS